MPDSFPSIATPVQNLFGAGVVKFRSSRDFAATVDTLTRLLRDHGLTIFATIDFAGDAARAGLALRPEQLLIFGNPKAGTPLLDASAIVGLDLPLKVLVWEDADAATWIAYNAVDYIAQRHAIPSDLARAIAGAGELIDSLGQA